MTPLTRLLLAAMALCFLATACTDDGPTQAEFNEAMQGVPANPDAYELTVVSCVNDGEFIRYTWGVTNLSDETRTFAFDPYLTNAAGEEEQKNRRLVSESLAPGEYVEWDGGEGGGERFPLGDVECRFEVVDSIFEEFQDN